jgi:hypothetical protein
MRRWIVDIGAIALLAGAAVILISVLGTPHYRKLA